MVVSAVDLLYVSGDPLFCLSDLTPLVQFAVNHCGDLKYLVPRIGTAKVL